MHLMYVDLHEVTWRGCMVFTERAEMAAVSCGTSHVSTISTPLSWIFKTQFKKLVTHVESHASAVSLLQSEEQRYTKAINNNDGNSMEKNSS